MKSYLIKRVLQGVLLVVSVFTGALTGFVAAVLFSAMEKAKIAPGS